MPRDTTSGLCRFPLRLEQSVAPSLYEFEFHGDRDAPSSSFVAQLIHALIVWCPALGGRLLGVASCSSRGVEQAWFLLFT